MIDMRVTWIFCQSQLRAAKRVSPKRSSWRFPQLRAGRLEKHGGQFGHLTFWDVHLSGDVVSYFTIGWSTHSLGGKGRIIKNLIYLECLTWSSPLRQVDCFRSLGPGTAHVFHSWHRHRHSAMCRTDLARLYTRYFSTEGHRTVSTRKSVKGVCDFDWNMVPWSYWIYRIMYC